LALDYEQLLITNELSEIIRWHNQCLDRLRSYRETYPYLLAPNVAYMLEDNLKENVQMLYRELNNLHKPKTEQRRHVCSQCHGVFAASLPGGICDECRGRGVRPQPPPARAAEAVEDSDGPTPDHDEHSPEEVLGQGDDSTSAPETPTDSWGENETGA
jgi:hypothetical protein